LLGPNGAGKSTLLRILTGFLQPTRGRATIAGLDCYRQSVEVHRRVAYLPGDARLFRSMRGREVVTFFGRFRDRGYPARARDLSERLQLDLKRHVSAMSTGMRQKLALVTVLSADTPVVILDEPTSNLDPTMRAKVVELVREKSLAGQTVLFSSHVLDEVERSCDRVVILRRGELVHEQVMRDLRRQHRVRARLTGPLLPPPAHLAGELNLHTDGDSLTIETPCELSSMLGWLATLPLAEMQIEPIGLEAVYERFHPRESHTPLLSVSAAR
jgi:ABC-2 type transport system ATP-binding protein